MRNILAYTVYLFIFVSYTPALGQEKKRAEIEALQRIFTAKIEETHRFW